MSSSHSHISQVHHGIIEQGHELMQAHRHQEALALFKTLPEFVQKSPRVQIEMADFHDYNKSFSKADEIYQRLSKQHYSSLGDARRIFVGMARHYRKQGKFTEAQEALKKIPDQSHYAVQLAYIIIANDKKDFVTAHTLVDKLIKQQPHSSRYAAAKANIYFKAGQIAAANAYLENALQKFPNDRELLITKAHLLAKKEDSKSASTMDNISEKLSEKDQALATKFKYHHLQRDINDDPNKIPILLELINNKIPGIAELAYTISVGLVLAGRNQEAVIILEAVLSNNSKTFEWMKTYFTCLFMLGKYEKAQKAGQVILTHYSISLSEIIRKRIILSFAYSGAMEEALILANAFVASHPSSPDSISVQVQVLELLNHDPVYVAKKYEELCLRFPSKTSFTLMHARYADKNLDYKMSIDILKKFIEHSKKINIPNNELARIHTHLALSYGQLNDYKSKLMHAKLATHLDPNYAVAFSVYGHALKENEGKKNIDHIMVEANAAFTRARQLDVKRFNEIHGAEPVSASAQTCEASESKIPKRTFASFFDAALLKQTTASSSQASAKKADTPSASAAAAALSAAKKTEQANSPAPVWAVLPAAKSSPFELAQDEVEKPIQKLKYFKSNLKSKRMSLSDFYKSEIQQEPLRSEKKRGMSV